MKVGCGPGGKGSPGSKSVLYSSGSGEMKGGKFNMLIW